MAIKMRESSPDETRGLSAEEASKLIPRVELEEPFSDVEVIVVSYWQHIRKCQLLHMKYKLNPTRASLNQLLSLLYELPPPYDINRIPEEFRQQAEHLEESRRELTAVKPFLGAFRDSELRKCGDKSCSFCNHMGLVAHETPGPPPFLSHVSSQGTDYYDAYWCPNCKKTLLPNQIH